MALKDHDFDFLVSKSRSFKLSFFQLLSQLGPAHRAEFVVEFREIKDKTGRERLTNVTLKDYISFFERQGFSARINNEAISLSINISSIVTESDEGIELANALQAFRAVNGN